jgi:hypothetical protein
MEANHPAALRDYRSFEVNFIYSLDPIAIGFLFRFYSSLCLTLKGIRENASLSFIKEKMKE